MMINHEPLRQVWSNIDTVLISMLLLVTCVLFGVALDVGEFWWTDESRHAMDGVYFLDLLKDRPFDNLYEYTVQYFARYPALGLTWYPPFFAFVESLVFAIFGVSEVSARFTVLLFCIVGLSAWYVWARPIWGSLATFFACLFFSINSYVLLWGRSVMLEVPGVAMMMLALLFFHYYLRRPSHILSIVTGLTLAAMLLTKQVTALMLPVLLVYAIASGSVRHLWSPRSIWAYFFVAAALLMLVIHAETFGVVVWKGFNASPGDIGFERFLGRMTVNAKVVWEAYPLPLLLLVATGILASVSVQRKGADIFILSWVVIWYVFFIFVSVGSSNLLRYTIYLTPAMGFLAVRGLDFFATGSKYRAFAIASLAVLYAGYGYSELRSEHMMASGYKEAAEFVVSQDSAGTVLFCCENDGNFTFHVKKNDADRKEVVLRGDKIFVSFVVHKHYGVVSYVENESDVYQLLDRYGVELLVVEDRDLVDVPEFKLLLQVLKSDRFERIKEIDVVSNVPRLQDLKIQIFRYKDRKKIEGGEIVIPMPHLGRELRLQVE